jgi:hypothetical protein
LDASSVTTSDFHGRGLLGLYRRCLVVLGPFGLTASLLGADSFTGFKSVSVAGSARRTTSFGFGGWTGIAFSSSGQKILAIGGATKANAQNRAVKALRNMRETFVDHPPPAWQAFCSKFYAELLRLCQADPDHWQRKAQPQFVFEENLDVMHPELLELHAAEIMDVRGVPLHLSQLEFHLGLRQHLLLINADNPRFLPEFSRAVHQATKCITACS